MSYLQQLLSCSVVRNADDDLISHNEVLQQAILAGAQKSTKIGQKGIERFTGGLCPLTEQVSFVGYVELSNRVTFKRLDDSVQVLEVLEVCTL